MAEKRSPYRGQFFNHHIQQWIGLDTALDALSAQLGIPHAESEIRGRDVICRGHRRSGSLGYLQHLVANRRLSAFHFRADGTGAAIDAAVVTVLSGSARPAARARAMRWAASTEHAVKVFFVPIGTT
jgi:hypothetical protein